MKPSSAQATTATAGLLVGAFLVAFIWVDYLGLVFGPNPVWPEALFATCVAVSGRLMWKDQDASWRTFLTSALWGILIGYAPFGLLVGVITHVTTAGYGVNREAEMLVMLFALFLPAVGLPLLAGCGVIFQRRARPKFRKQVGLVLTSLSCAIVGLVGLWILVALVAGTADSLRVKFSGPCSSHAMGYAERAARRTVSRCGMRAELSQRRLYVRLDSAGAVSGARLVPTDATVTQKERCFEQQFDLAPSVSNGVCILQITATPNWLGFYND